MGRGKSARTLELIDAATAILERIQPATVRAVCYQLFVRGVLRDMSKSETNRVSAALTWAREQGRVDWAWVVDETRQAERPWTWADPREFVADQTSRYRRDRWALQPRIVEVWSEKGTVRGTLSPVLDALGVTFRVMHGYASATAVNEVAEDAARDANREFWALYVGDWDPSGLHMSEVDLPRRLREYGAETVLVERVALKAEDLSRRSLPSFPTDSKRADPRWRWYRERYGHRSWELDALSPTVLRERVRSEIQYLIEPQAWARCERAESLEQESLERVLTRWSRIHGHATK